MHVIFITDGMYFTNMNFSIKKIVAPNRAHNKLKNSRVILTLSRHVYASRQVQKHIYRGRDQPIPNKKSEIAQPIPLFVIIFIFIFEFSRSNINEYECLRYGNADGNTTGKYIQPEIVSDDRLRVL